MNFPFHLYRIALLLLACAGCSQLHVPAIDPSGQRIFLPGQSTTIDPGGCFSRPAYTAPAVPPPCPTVGTGVPVGPPCPPPTTTIVSPAVAGPVAPAPVVVPQGTLGNLVVTPGRIVAPVGTEVVLKAGVLGADGKFAACEKIEWLLSQDSVGQFANLANEGEPLWRVLTHTAPKKLSSDYAVGRTTKTADVITRGTPNPADDIQLAPGETWISVTSATEGSSHVTVLAPGAAGWDQRRRTAAVHWVDAQWSLPPTAIVSAGQKHVLTTTVTRQSTGAPAVGWIVRYEIIGGPVAGPAEGTEGSVSEVVTDANGGASVELTPYAPQAGVTQVQIQIIRPAMASGDLSRLVVGSGFTNITWSAPGLAVRTSGPEQIDVNTAGTYRIEVSNPGDMPAQGVVVSNAIPPGLSYVNSNPPAQIFGDRVEWQIGELAPRDARVIEVNCRGTQGGDVRNCVSARSREGLTAQSCVATRIFSSDLSVRMQGPPSAEVGEKLEFRIEITNTGGHRLANVRLSDRYDRGLAHVQGQPSPITRSLGDLAPGETKRLAISFAAVEVGRQCHQLQATADGGHAATADGCVIVTQQAAPPEARAQVRISGPTQGSQGETVVFVLELVNNGQADLTNVQLQAQLPPALTPQEASLGHQANLQGIFWSIPRIAPGEQIARQVNCLCKSAGPARVQAVVAADQPIQLSDSLTIQIAVAPPASRPPAAGQTNPVPGSGGAAAAPPSATGRLAVNVSALANPIKVGGRTTYLIEISNGRNVEDKNVAMTITLPDGLRFEKFSGATQILRTSPDGRTLEVTPVAEIRPGGNLPPYRLEATGVKPGKYTLRVSVVSLRERQEIVEEQETTVFVE